MAGYRRANSSCIKAQRGASLPLATVVLENQVEIFFACYEDIHHLGSLQQTKPSKSDAGEFSQKIPGSKISDDFKTDG